MLLELCITELEDTASNSHTFSYVPQPVVQETSHPYIDDITLRGTSTLRKFYIIKSFDYFYERLKFQILARSYLFDYKKAKIFGLLLIL